MAIGSTPEIGVTFHTWGQMSPEQRTAWFLKMKSWGPDLVAGYGTVAFPDPNRVQRLHDHWEAL